MTIFMLNNADRMISVMKHALKNDSVSF